MMTLKELKKRVPVADKNGSVLGKTELLNSGAKIVVKEMVDTGVEISVFDNGYVLFEEDKHK
ncbi:MAG: sigma-70 family RNA polymerase sigma factor, partial [Marvinbryantia sp.]